MPIGRSVGREMLSRVIGAGVGFVFGVLYGVFILSGTPERAHPEHDHAGAALLAAGAAGAASLALAAPLLSVEPYLWLERTLDEAPAGQIIGGLIGLIAALLISAMVAVLLNPLPLGPRRAALAQRSRPRSSTWACAPAAAAEMRSASSSAGVRRTVDIDREVPARSTASR